MGRRLRWVAVQSDAIHLERLDRLLSDWPGGVGCQRFTQPAHALEWLAMHPCEVIFGPADLSFWHQIPSKPARVVLGQSARDCELAAEYGFDGYIARPYRAEKVIALCARIAHQYATAHKIWAKEGDQWHLIDAEQIRFAEVRNRKTWLFTGHEPLLFPQGLARLHEQVPALLRIHRHLLIAPHWVTDLGQQGVRVDGHPLRLPVSRRQKKDVMRRVLQADHGLMTP